MLSVTKSPDWKGRVAPSLSFDDVVPKDRFGRPITWNEEINPTPVFLHQYQIEASGHDVYLIGLRYDTSKMLLNGRPGSAGFFLQFIVIEFVGADQHYLHILRQHRGPIFSVAHDGKDWLWASELKFKREKLLLGSHPKWEESEAQWPIVSGKPMLFIGQVSLPENDVTKTHLTWDKRIFLFWQAVAGASVFKLFSQDCDIHTSEAHYASESA